MLIEVLYEGMGRIGDDTVVVLWCERNGMRRCAMFFDLELTRWIRAALRKFAQDGMPIAHGGLQQFMARHLGTYVSRVTIPDIRKNDAYRMVVHFRTPAGTITEEFLPSDAVAMLMYADCPLFVEEWVLDKASAVAPTPDQLRTLALEREQVAAAEEQATSLPADKLPKS